MATQYPDQLQAVGSIEDEINRFCDRIIECVDLRRKKLLAEVSEMREEKRASLVRKQESAQQLSELKSDTERKLKVNILRETQEKIIKEIDERLSYVSLHEVETRLVFKGDSGQLQELILGMGEVLEQEIPIVPHYQNLRATVAVGKRGLGDGEIYEPRAIAVDEKTYNVYITQGAPLDVKYGRVSIYSETGEFLNSFGQKLLKDPRGIAIHGNYVYVTECKTHRVYQFKQEIDIRLVSRVGGYGSKNGKFIFPSQVCVSTNGDVYVTDYWNNRIQILNSSLQFQRSLSHPSMTWPYDIKLTKDGIYVLSDNNPHCIHVFSHTGEKIRSLITQGERKEVRRAFYFCMDANKNIIVSDRDAHFIKVFSNEGMLVHIISEQGHEKGMLESPQGIALTKDLRLVVVSGNINYSLQIFSC